MEWKSTHVVAIPKHGKSPDDIKNLRSISLTSCIGKLMEKMAQAHIEWTIEESQAFSYTITGFRRHVSAQDTILRIHKDIMEREREGSLLEEKAETFAGITTPTCY